MKYLSLPLFAILLATASAQTPDAKSTNAKPTARYVDTLAKSLNPGPKDRLQEGRGSRTPVAPLSTRRLAGVGQAPVLRIAIHGGGWTGGDPSRMYAFADHYAKLGLVGISVQYRLFNGKAGVTVLDCVKDARSAVRHARAHANELGIDPQKIIVSGSSAGGHLSAATAMFDTINDDSDGAKVSASANALILLFPVIDASTQGYGNAKCGERWQ